MRRRQVRGLRSQKKRSLLFVNEHFYDERNEEIGVFLLTLDSARNKTRTCTAIQPLHPECSASTNFAIRANMEMT